MCLKQTKYEFALIYKDGRVEYKSCIWYFPNEAAKIVKDSLTMKEKQGLEYIERVDLY